MKILVTGGTGTVGTHVVRQLVERGAGVRALVRNQESAGKLPKGVEPALGDLLDPVAVGKALDGIDKLYLLNGVAPDELTQGLIACGLAKRHKLEHLVYQSVFRAEHFPDVPHFASKVAIEAAIKASGVPFTIIRPNYFYQNDTRLKDVLTGAGVYPTPFGTPGVSAVDVRDIAEATAITLTADGHLGKTYNQNGPEPLSGPHAAAIWSGVLGKAVKYPGEDLDGFEAQMRKAAPAWLAFEIRMMFQGHLERGFVAAAGDVEALTRLLGHPPRRYEDFVQETARTWKA